MNAFAIKMNEAVRNIDGKADPVIRTGNIPEQDVSPVLDDKKENYYQNLIGVLRQAVDIFCIDIHVEVALLYRFLAQPRNRLFLF